MMNKPVTAIFSRAFIAGYVLIGYIRHYITRVAPQTAITVTVIVILLSGVAINSYLKPRITGNDALNRAYDLKNAGRLNAAHKSFDHAYQIFSSENYGRGMFVALRNLGEMDQRLSNPQEALFHYDAALKLAQQYNDTNAQIDLFVKHADIKLLLKRVDAARAHLYDAIKIAQDTQNNNVIGALFTRVGNLERDIGNDRRARFAYRSAMQHYAEHQNIKGQANLHWNIATLDSILENYDDAITGYVTARDLFKTGNDIYGEATVVKHMARLEKKFGSEQKAASYYNEAATLYASIGKNEEVISLRNEAAGLLL